MKIVISILLFVLLSVAISCDSDTVRSPTITSFTPKSGIVTSVITIRGTDFSATAANNHVSFNRIDAEVSKAAATELTVMVPAGATTGEITVTVDGNTATSDHDFTVTNLGLSSEYTLITTFVAKVAFLISFFVCLILVLTTLLILRALLTNDEYYKVPPLA